MKFIPYSHQHISVQDIREVSSALKADLITQGPRVKEFEVALCRYTKAKYAVVVSSGTAALHLSMLALGIGAKDGVVTSPITFSASANCAVYVGARPFFVDIDKETYHLSVDKLKAFLKNHSKRNKVKAVIPVHFMGTVIDIKEISEVCDKYGVKVIEDAAHALGAEYQENDKRFKVGSCRHSDVAIFSFHPIKHITTGEGGAILTNNKKIYEKALRLRHHGIARKRNWLYDIPQIGFNYRLSDIQSALGLSQLKRIDNIVRERRRLVKNYNDSLAGICGIVLPFERNDTRASYHLYVIKVPALKRDKLHVYLRNNGILSQVNYIPVHLFSYYQKNFGYKRGDFPVAEDYFKQCLSLPLYPGLTQKEQLKVIRTVKKFFRA